MRGIDGMIYINLDHRTDRKKLMENELDRFGIPPEKIHRLSAVYNQLNGTKGCLLSHIKALTLAIENGWEKVLILEDDIIFSKKLDAIESQLESFFRDTDEQWDVFFLGGAYREMVETSWTGVIQIHNSWCAHAYIVHRHYLEKLRACFLSAYELIKDHFFNNQSLIYSLDQVWRVLQRSDRWYAGKEQSILQRVGTSDIDPVYEPLNRFKRVVYIDNGNEKRLLKELERVSLDMGRVYRAESHLGAIECALNIGGQDTLIIEDTVLFPEDLKILDQTIVHFLKWRGYDWELFLFDGAGCKVQKTSHPDFRQVTELASCPIYAVFHTYYEALYHHLKSGKSFSSLAIKPQNSVFCSL
ncbi:MAG: glycosyltransferase family 25 protein [Simkaniaceae bacterium]|nr:MAG: glycosyltransferase family 25 protein [Simkaniaceae bacterium]